MIRSLLITCFVVTLLCGMSLADARAQAGASVAPIPKEMPRASSQGPGGYPAPGAAAPMAPQPEYVPPPQADPDRRLGVGDQVTFSIVEDRDPAVVLRVTDTGELEVPYIGRVNVAGKTATAAAAEIKRKLEADYYYVATVRLGIDTVNRVSSVGRINVAGAVRAPGVIVMVSGEKLTLSGAILKAGGFTQFGDSRKVKVTRKSGGNNRSLTVDVKDILENGKVSEDMVLEDGDYVYVPQRLITW